MACGPVCRRHYFLYLSKESNQRKDTTKPNLKFRLSHEANPSRVPRNFRFARFVDIPRAYA
jgi:hypothetical protein